MGFNQLFLHKERETLTERDKEIVWIRDGFLLRVVSLALLWFAYDMKLVWENNF